MTDLSLVIVLQLSNDEEITVADGSCTLNCGHPRKMSSVMKDDASAKVVPVMGSVRTLGVNPEFTRSST